jgi:hypothetical protein
MPKDDLRDGEILYRDYFEQSRSTVADIVCASCGCLYHDPSLFSTYGVTAGSLSVLVCPDDYILPVSFRSGIPSIDERRIMIDPKSVSPDRSCLQICKSCSEAILRGRRPKEALANYRYYSFIGDLIVVDGWMIVPVNWRICRQLKHS